MLTMFIGKAKAVIASDGGANHLFNSAHRDANNLHSIVGDMDSLEGSTLSYYQTKGVAIHKDEGQDNNDFEKAVILAGKLGFRTLVCLGALGGRIDQ